MDIDRSKKRFDNYVSLTLKPGKRWNTARDAQGSLVKQSIVAVIEEDIARWPEVTDAMKAELSPKWVKEKEEEWADHALEAANAAVSSQSQDVTSKHSTQETNEPSSSHSIAESTRSKNNNRLSRFDKQSNPTQLAGHDSGSHSTVTPGKKYNTVAVPSRKRGHLADKKGDLPLRLVNSHLVKGAKMPNGQRHYVRLGEKVNLSDVQFKAAALSIPSADRIEEPPDLDLPDKDDEPETFEGWTMHRSVERNEEEASKCAKEQQDSVSRSSHVQYQTYIAKLEELNAPESESGAKREHEDDSSSDEPRKKRRLKRCIQSSDNEDNEQDDTAEDHDDDGSTTVKDVKGKKRAVEQVAKESFVEFITSLQDEVKGMKNEVQKVQKKHMREADLTALEERIGRLSYLLKDGKKRA
ncbi:hypothetical protein CALCODRAFT_512210 [Calocera cornea HHB12733]|uniref:Uncharacterized protein n=1 Tax=Calocera cornea HHB12733 TaxID=1353952 RepID=A0A165D7E3_9BASI|nr:hypothetical protein CALCODRAFT_512210 [Calocera cornea HHB12733]